MPLIKSSSKKAFRHNVEAEMHAHPDDPKRDLAIAYSVKRKNAKKKASGGSVQSGSPDMNYADGGNVSVRDEKRPMPDDLHNDSKMASQNKGNKPPKNDNWLDNPTIKQAQANNSRKVMPIKHPKMVPQSVYSTRLRDEEDDLQSSASPGAYDQQPPAHDNEEGPNRQGPPVSDMAPEHSTHSAPYVKEIEDQYAQDMAEADMKRSQSYARGGQIEASDRKSHNINHRTEMEPMDDSMEMEEREEQNDHQRMDSPSEDEGSSYAHNKNEVGPDRAGLDKPDKEEPHSAHDRMQRDNEHMSPDVDMNPAHHSESGMSLHHEMDEQPEHEEDMEHEDSIAAAIMAKRKKMARGGEILEDAKAPLSHGSMDTHEDEDQVDLSRNADEDANEEDQASFNALRKENYSETPGLDELDSPMDSAQHGDEEESDSENKYDRIDKMRSKMNAKRQFKQR